MTAAMAELGAPVGEEAGLAAALPSWEPFPEVPPVLEEARARGWKLAVLSNSDRDLIEASLAQIGVPFELAVVASEIRSYKPAHAHWLHFFEQTGSETLSRHRAGRRAGLALDLDQPLRRTA